MTEWQPIDTAPKDGTMHMRGLYVHQKRAGMCDFIYWDCYAGSIDDETGEWNYLCGDHLGWDVCDFTHWMPLPNPPGLDND